MREPSPAEGHESSGRSSFFQRLWTSAGSARTAVFLLCILAFLSALGTLIPQNESGEFYAGKYGMLPGRLIIASSLDTMYYAWWFLLLLVLVAINLVVSNMKRLETLRGLSKKKGAAAPGRAYFLNSPLAVRFTAKDDDEKIRADLEQALRRLGYRLKREPRGDEVCYLAEKGALRRWGSLVTHTGILIVFLGVIYGHWPGNGFSGTAHMTPHGEDSLFELTQAGFSLKMLDTGSKSDEKGRPLDYFSIVEVQKEGKKVLGHTIRVNDPLEFEGVKFYQSDFGVLGFYLDVEGPDGVAQNVPVHLTMEGAPDMDLPIEVPGTDLSLFLHRYIPDGQGAEVFLYEHFVMDSYNKWVAKGWVSKGTPLSYKGYRISMGNQVCYSGLQYRKDPGVPLVWAGFFLMILGLALSFYVTEKTIHILVLPGEGEHSILAVTHSPADEDFDEELSALRKSWKEH
ncbi:MAG: cytochrome c biogenesis protein ResB [Candidatus Eremiobacteraeota bacterium]|nr:cytochrome c biogenesis protein ResB [Candidatus Eremiobacteraeota bacterium]